MESIAAAEFVRAATALSRRVGLADRVSFVAGDALDLPFPAASFDLAWTQHAAMNIADRPRLYAEMHRVLRPGGLAALVSDWFVHALEPSMATLGISPVFAGPYTASRW